MPQQANKPARDELRPLYDDLISFAKTCGGAKTREQQIEQEFVLRQKLQAIQEARLKHRDATNLRPEMATKFNQAIHIINQSDHGLAMAFGKECQSALDHLAVSFKKIQKAKKAGKPISPSDIMPKQAEIGEIAELKLPSRLDKKEHEAIKAECEALHQAVHDRKMAKTPQEAVEAENKILQASKNLSDFNARTKDSGLSKDIVKVYKAEMADLQKHSSSAERYIEETMARHREVRSFYGPKKQFDSLFRKLDQLAFQALDKSPAEQEAIFKQMESVAREIDDLRGAHGKFGTAYINQKFKVSADKMDQVDPTLKDRIAHVIQENRHEREAEVKYKKKSNINQLMGSLETQLAVARVMKDVLNKYDQTGNGAKPEELRAMFEDRIKHITDPEQRAAFLEKFDEELFGLEEGAGIAALFEDTPEGPEDVVPPPYNPDAAPPYELEDDGPPAPLIHRQANPNDTAAANLGGEPDDDALVLETDEGPAPVQANTADVESEDALEITADREGADLVIEQGTGNEATPKMTNQQYLDSLQMGVRRLTHDQYQTFQSQYVDPRNKGQFEGMLCAALLDIKRTDIGSDTAKKAGIIAAAGLFGTPLVGAPIAAAAVHNKEFSGYHQVDMKNFEARADFATLGAKQRLIELNQAYKAAEGDPDKQKAILEQRNEAQAQFYLASQIQVYCRELRAMKAAKTKMSDADIKQRLDTIFKYTPRDEKDFNDPMNALYNQLRDLGTNLNFKESYSKDGNRRIGYYEERKYLPNKHSNYELNFQDDGRISGTAHFDNAALIGKPRSSKSTFPNAKSAFESMESSVGDMVEIAIFEQGIGGMDRPFVFTPFTPEDDPSPSTKSYEMVLAGITKVKECAMASGQSMYIQIPEDLQNDPLFQEAFGDRPKPVTVEITGNPSASEDEKALFALYAQQKSYSCSKKGKPIESDHSAGENYFRNCGTKVDYKREHSHEIDPHKLGEAFGDFIEQRAAKMVSDCKSKQDNTIKNQEGAAKKAEPREPSVPQQTQDNRTRTGMNK